MPSVSYKRIVRLKADMDVINDSSRLSALEVEPLADFP